jgi:heme/copper-type cytochrome/quinol oxidase subunit 3
MAVHHAAPGMPVPEAQTSTGVDNKKLFMWLFLGSDCLFFGSLIATYLLYRGRDEALDKAAGVATRGPYPHELFDIPYTSVSSFVLLMSSLTMVLALAAIQRGDVRRLRIWLLATALLGMVFLGGQAYEFTSFVHEGLTIRTNLFGSTFFVLTGFHGAHVAVGVLILMSVFSLASQGRIQQKDSLTVELAGLYWHFVDVVWILIFTLIYLLPQ